jgi:SRSO17 transposase
VTGDEVYGADSRLRAALHERAIGYVLAVACDHQIATLAGKHPAKALARRLPSRAWNRLSAGIGAKGHRWYDWALIDITDPEAPGDHALLVRRSISTGELAFYRCYTPTPVPLSTLVAVAGRRWTIEESFQAGKGLTGLDEHQVRRWTSWHRWTVLAMLAHAFLAVMTATARAETPSPQGLIAHQQRDPPPVHPTRQPHPTRHPTPAAPAHATATTAVRQPSSPDHELRLEY